MRIGFSLTRVVVALAVVQLGFTASALAGDAVSLKLKFEKGRTSYLEIASDSKSDIVGPTGPMKTVINRVNGQTQTVDSTGPDGTQLTLTFDRSKLEMDTPMMGQLSFDSDLPTADDPPNLKQMFEPMIGKSIQIKLDKDAHAIDVIGVEAIVKAVTEKASGNPFAMGFERYFNKKLFMARFNTAFDKLPAKDVKPGDTWKYPGEEEVPMVGMAVRFDCTCKLDSVSKRDGHDAAFVSYEGPAKEVYTKIETGQQMPKFSVKSGTMKGSYVFDLTLGKIVEEKTNSEFSLAPAAEKDAKDAKSKKDEKDGGGSGAPKITISTMIKTHVALRAVEDRAKEKAVNARKTAELKAKEDKEDGDSDDDKDAGGKKGVKKD